MKNQTIEQIIISMLKYFLWVGLFVFGIILYTYYQDSVAWVMPLGAWLAWTGDRLFLKTKT